VSYRWVCCIFFHSTKVTIDTEKGDFNDAINEIIAILRRMDFKEEPLLIWISKSSEPLVERGVVIEGIQQAIQQA